MQITKEQLTKRLIATVQDLPIDHVQSVLDFADYLHTKFGQHQPVRGSAEAVIQAIQQAGPLMFETGELDQILVDIDRLHNLD